jgi:hypothetical protein
LHKSLKPIQDPHNHHIIVLIIAIAIATLFAILRLPVMLQNFQPERRMTLEPKKLVTLNKVCLLDTLSRDYLLGAILDKTPGRPERRVAPHEVQPISG